MISSCEKYEIELKPGLPVTESNMRIMMMMMMRRWRNKPRWENRVWNNW